MDTSIKNDPSEDFSKIELNSKQIEENISKLDLAKASGYSDAICLIQKQLALNYNERGFRWYKRVEFVDAERDFTRSIKFGTSANCPVNCEPDLDTLSAAYYNRGTVLYRMSKFELAKKDLEKAVELKPNNSEFRLGLEETLKQIKKPDL